MSGLEECSELQGSYLPNVGHYWLILNRSWVNKLESWAHIVQTVSMGGKPAQPNPAQPSLAMSGPLQSILVQSGPSQPDTVTLRRPGTMPSSDRLSPQHGGV